MAEQIAMLDGLGAYGEKPIGDVDPRLLPSYQTTPAPALMQGRIPTYPPKPYTLGSGEADLDLGRDEGMSGTSKLLIALGIGGVLVWASQSKGSTLQGDAGYPEPEMVKLEGAKRRRRRRKKK